MLACRRRPAYRPLIGQQIVHRLAIAFGTSAIDAFYGDRDRAFSILVTPAFSFRRPGIRDPHHGETELQAYSADQGLKGIPPLNPMHNSQFEIPGTGHCGGRIFSPGSKASSNGSQYACRPVDDVYGLLSLALRQRIFCTLIR